MPMFTIRYDLTERTVQDIDIEADSLDEAKRLVEEYNFDNGEAREVTSSEWSIDNVHTPGECIEMSWYKIRNIDSKSDFSMDGHVQRWTQRGMAQEYRDKLISSTGQRHRVYAFYPPTVGNPNGGKPRD